MNEDGSVAEVGHNLYCHEYVLS